MKENPLVSILVANHNNAKYIREALDSIVNQTYSNIEIIVVDDASTDDSISIIENYIKMHPNNSISFYQNYFSFGCGKVKRKCADIARGKYFAFLDPDDAIVDDAVEKLVRIHEQDSKYSIVYSSQWLCNENLEVQSKATWVGAIPAGCSNLTSTKGHVSAFALCKKSCYDQSEGINPNYVVAEDQDLYFKMEEIAPVFFFDEPLYYYRKHDHNMSFDDDKETRNLYWLYQCRKAAYNRRKSNKTIPNTTSKALMTLKLNYYLTHAKSLRKSGQWYWGELFKAVPLMPLSARKSVRKVRSVFEK